MALNALSIARFACFVRKPMPAPRRTRPIRERLLDKVEYEPNTGCWIWLGAVSRPSGHGVIARGRREDGTTYAHRVAYEEFVGPIPDGYVVCHRCDTPCCVNPDHLWADEQRANVHDMMRKGRGRGQIESWDTQPLPTPPNDGIPF